ncbi:hypothetical protein IT409_00425 [Candidatus Falkowbacteria bacterium]|nr:hypothetical protein [Candidatus Falkowbacteria bacterium]
MNDYVPLLSKLMNISEEESQVQFEDMFNDVVEESVNGSTHELEFTDGGQLILLGVFNPKYKVYLNKIKEEGVTEKDIHSWWDMEDYERRMMLKIDDLMKATLFIKATTDDGMSPEEASKLVRKFHVYFGSPEDTKFASGEDRNLPFELKNRINNYINRRINTDPEVYATELQNFTSFNAFVRSKIKEGVL